MSIGETPTQSFEPAESELDLRALLNVVLRRRWLVLGVLAASLVAGVLVTVRAPRIFQARATILIERHPPQVLSEVREVYDLGTGAYWSAREYYRTQYNVIRSTPVAQKAATALGLVPAALAEQLRSAGPASLESQASGDPLLGLPASLQSKLQLLGLHTRSSRDAILEALETLAPDEILQARLQVEPVEESQLAVIAIEDTDPERAALLANAIVDAYIELNLEQKTDTTRSAVDWLSSQMHELKEKLAQSELALHDFKEANAMVSVSMEDRQTITSESLSQLNRSLSETHAERLALESRRSRIRRQREEGLAGDTLGEVIANPLVQQLKAAYSKLEQEETDLALRYTPEHPKLISVRKKLEHVSRDLDTEIDKILRSLDGDYQAALETEQRLKAAINRVKAEALEINKKEIEYNRLKRERDNNLALYQLVLKRQKEADLSQLLKVNNIRKLEAARPPKGPIRPRVELNLLIALLLGLAGGVGLAYLVDYLDNTVKTQAQVEQLLGLPFLGIVPAIRGDKGARLVDATSRDHYVIVHPRSSVAECCRTIRTNLLFMSPERPAQSLLVASGGPREGKSTTVVNLAVTMAQAGSRTLIVDTDMRRPRMHKSFGVDNHAGISSLILGENSLDEVIQATVVERLELITCGPLPPNPAELLHTGSFKKIVDELTERYDRVVFDSPPVAAVTDALVLGSMMDGVVLVIEAGQTSWQAARQAKKHLEDVGGRMFGAVLNNVDLEDKRSGTYYQYYYYYRSGYEYSEKETEERKQEAS